MFENFQTVPEGGLSEIQIRDLAWFRRGWASSRGEGVVIGIQVQTSCYADDSVNTR